MPPIKKYTWKHKKLSVEIVVTASDYVTATQKFLNVTHDGRDWELQTDKI